MTASVKGLGMECAESLALLSDLHDGMLPELMQAMVREHLSLCPPCKGVYIELETIILTAKALSDDAGLTFPDETIIWQKLSITRGGVQ